MMSKNIDSLQVLRAVAACSVVFTHIFGAKFPVIGSAGIFGVDLFFALSGFLMTITYRESRTGYEFLKGRVLRIYPVYLVLSIPLILWSAHKDPSSSLVNAFHNITLLPTIHGNYVRANYVCWTLTYEMYFYVVMASCMYFFKGVKKVIFSTSFVMLIIFILSGGLSDGVSGWADNSISNLSNNYIVIDFIIGSVIGILYKGSSYKKNGLPIAIAVTLFILVSFIITKFQPSPEGYEYQIFTFFFSGIPACFLLYIISKIKIEKIPFHKIMVYLGSASYSIYLTHLYVKLSIAKLNYPSYFLKPAGFMVAILIGCAAYHLIERNLNKKLKRL